MNKEEFAPIWNKAISIQKKIMMNESNHGVGKHRLFKRAEISQLSEMGWGYLNEFQKAAIVSRYDMGYFERLNLLRDETKVS